MLSRLSHRLLLLGLITLSSASYSFAEDNAYSVPPCKRPLPAASDRPMGKGHSLFVDAAKGNDTAAGSEKAPFKTIQHALGLLKPGDTLYLRGGTYYEQPQISVRGEKNAPITLRAYPNELVIIDGGLREFVDHPETAWVPCPGGVDGEFWSANTFEPQGDTRAIEVPGGVNVQGHFADTMVPMQGYWSLGDLRSTNEYWNLPNRRDKAATTQPLTAEEAESKPPTNIYCGPGIAYDPATKHIHVRLAHTTLTGTGDDNFRGETDPRKLRLSISRPGHGSVIHIEDTSHLVLQDLVVRGSRGATIEMTDSEDINLEGLFVYAGQNCIQASYTKGLHATQCAFRGIAAPWTFRSSLKYRSIEARIISASGWQPQGNSDFEFERCDFTDSVDGIFIANVHNVKLHHNYIDNISDDCIFLTATTAFDGVTEGGNIHIYQNYISRTLTVLAFGVGHGRQKLTPEGRQLGKGVWFYRNVVDERQWIPYFQHRGPEDYEFASVGRMSGDHGSPTWEPMNLYNNTIVAGSGAFRDYYLNGMNRAIAKNAPRRLFNNVYVQIKGIPGFVFPQADTNLECTNNLHWGVLEGPDFKGDIFAKFRSGKMYNESKSLHSPGWTANDVFAEPKFTLLETDPNKPLDLRPMKGSPVADIGIDLPAEWPDPVRKLDQGKVDLGVLPIGVEPWPVGVGTLHDISGATHTPN